MLSFKSLSVFLGGSAIALLLSCFWSIKISGADNSSAWLSPASLTIQKQADLSTAPSSLNGNVDCFVEAGGTCAISTPYGTANTSASVTIGDLKDYRPVVSYLDNREHFIAIPNSNSFITYTTDPSIGFYFFFNYNFLSSVKQMDEGLGPFFKVITPPDGTLADKNGRKLPGDYGSLSFSENGDWMVVSDPNVAMLRVNLKTFEVLPFAPGFNYSIGLSPNVKTAISNDGRYAAVASKNNSWFRVYDLDNCSSVPSSITGPVSCGFRDLQSFMSQQVPGFSGIGETRFLNDGALGLYAGYTENGSNKVAKYILSNGPVINQQDYLALGDSYISGEGAFKYLPGTDTENSQCHVSSVSYPLLIGRGLDYGAYHSVACSGATTNDIKNSSTNYSGQIKNAPTRTELEKSGVISSILSSFEQGYIDQLDFVKQHQPKVITISIGGNDIGFSARLRQCLGLGTCYTSYEDRLEFVRETEKAFPKLVDTYTKLKSQGAANARIYVIGYPQIAKADGDCAVNVHMNHDELVFAEQAINYLDLVVKAAANQAGVYYVDTQDALNGHRLCEAKPGSVAMNGITAGNDFPDKLGGPIGRESYHPNDFGHLLLENKVLAATHNLTDPMPAADPSSGPPAEDGLDILNAPKSNRDINQTEYDPGLADDVVYKQAATEVTIDGSDHSLAPGTVLNAEVHSSPVNLGSFTVSPDDNLSARVSIPDSVPAGIHTLHFYGKDMAGRSIDIFKVIFVAYSPDDLDGNGISDTRQKCVGVEPANQDQDKDGIDDACDADISLPPAGASQPAAIAGITSSGNPSPVSFAPAPAIQNNPKVQTVEPIPIQLSTPKVLAAGTVKPASQNSPPKKSWLKPSLLLYGLGALIAVSFVVSWI